MANQNEKIVNEGGDIKRFFDYMRDIKGFSDSTLYQYMNYHKLFMDQELTQQNITKFLNKRKNHSVVRGYMMAYLGFLGKKREFELPERKTGSKRKKLPQLLSTEEIKTLIDFAYKTNKKHGMMIEVIYYGALRRFELGKIKVNEINWEKWFDDTTQFCEFNIIGKGKRERTVMMHPRSAKQILAFLLKSDHLYPNIPPADLLKTIKALDINLFKIDERWIYEKVRVFAERCLNRSIRTHQLRHARATHLEESGVSIRDIQNYLGHANIGTTEIYLHSDQSHSLQRIRELTKI